MTVQTNIKVKFLLVALFVYAASPMPCSTLFFYVLVVFVPLLVLAYVASEWLCNSDVYSAYSAATVTFCLPNHFRLSHPCFMYHFEFILTLFVHLSSHSIHLIWYYILPMLFFATFPLLLIFFWSCCFRPCSLFARFITFIIVAVCLPPRTAHLHCNLCIMAFFFST